MHRFFAFVRDTYPLSELLFALFLCLIALSISKLRIRLPRKKFTVSRLTAVLLCAIAPVAIRILLLPLEPPPLPQVHDEFSYLLAAKTFASGRISNPPPPFTEHFETFHENMAPTYHSIYPPAQGAWLAAGILLFRNPWAGVCLSVAALCGSICWALFACLPRNYAFFAGIIVAIRIGIHSYWIDSFWGGAVPACAGALLLGGSLRFIRKPKISNAVVISAGLAMLASSRPYEGLAFAIPILATCALSLVRSQAGWKQAAKPLSVIAACSLAFGTFLAFYNYRCTRSAVTMPYKTNISRYQQFGPFLWSPVKLRSHYTNARMESFYAKETATTLLPPFTFAKVVRFEREKMKTFDFFFVFPLLPFWLIGFIASFKRPKLRLLSYSALSTLVASAFVIWSAPHYFSPALVSTIGLLAQSIRELKVRLGRTAMAVNLPVLIVAAMFLYAMRVVSGSSVEEPAQTWGNDRARLEDTLAKFNGQQLILVQYAPDATSSIEEWVFNGPDVLAQKVIWARSLDPKGDSALAVALGARTWTLVVHSGYSVLRPGRP